MPTFLGKYDLFWKTRHPNWLLYCHVLEFSFTCVPRYLSCLLPLLPALDIPDRPWQLSRRGLAMSWVAWPPVEWTQKASASLWILLQQWAGTFWSNYLVISWFGFTSVFNLMLKGWNLPFKKKKKKLLSSYAYNIRRESQPSLLSWERKLFFLDWLKLLHFSLSLPTPV